MKYFPDCCRYEGGEYPGYEPYKAVNDMGKSLSGLKKPKYDKEHEHELTMHENTRADLKMLLAEGKR